MTLFRVYITIGMLVTGLELYFIYYGWQRLISKALRKTPVRDLERKSKLAASISEASERMQQELSQPVVFLSACTLCTMFWPFALAVTIEALW